MDKIYQLLKCLKNSDHASQRDIAKACGFSLGMVNTLLKSMEEQGLILTMNNGSKFEYELSESGKECLENVLRERQMDKIKVTDKTTHRQTAVILAAGANRDFKEPIGLLPLKDTTIIDRTLEILAENGIKKYVIVIGYGKEHYIEKFKSRSDVILVENKRYKWTGTMASLACAHPYIDSDFLLIESDYVFEKTVITQLLENNNPNCLFVNLPRGSGDEAFVELDENQLLFRISKDIHELNHIDGELTGVHKVSYMIFKKMMKLFDENKNPYINYEYVMENVGRIYKINTMSIDDCICLDVDNQKQYDEMLNLYYPKLEKKEMERNLEELKQLFLKIQGINEDDFISIEAAGGMTNTNYKVKTTHNTYVLRMPGKCTETMISRSNEKVNGKLGYLLGLNVDTVYFNEETGVKVSIYIENAQTMTGSTARLEKNMKLSSALLRKLHESEVELKGRFNVFEEIHKYEKIMDEMQVTPYPRYQEARDFFTHLAVEMDQLGWNLKPCHCDLVAENLIKDQQGRMYLIDWEYAGYNDPMWDLAAHFIECEFTESEEELYERYYFDGSECSLLDKRKIKLFKITQDVLWAAWTMAKEANGEDFGTYGLDRLNRGLELIQEYQNLYEREQDEQI